MLGFCHLGKPSVCRHAQIKPCSCHFSAGEERHNTKAFPRNTSIRVFLFFKILYIVCLQLFVHVANCSNWICFARFYASQHHYGGWRCDVGVAKYSDQMCKIFCKSPLWCCFNVWVLPDIQIPFFCKSPPWWWFNVCVLPNIQFGFLQFTIMVVVGSVNVTQY